MNEPARKMGKGRHGPRTKPDTRYSDVVKKAAEQRFTELAMPAAVSHELQIPYRTIWAWRRAWLLKKNGTPSVCSADADPLDEQP